LEQVIEQQTLKEQGDVTGAQQKALQVKDTSDKLTALKNKMALADQDNVKLLDTIKAARTEIFQAIANSAKFEGIDVVAEGPGSLVGAPIAAATSIDLSSVPDLTDVVLAWLAKTPVPPLQSRKPAIIDSGKIIDNYYRSKIAHDYIKDQNTNWEESGNLATALSAEVFKVINDYAAAHGLAILNIAPGGAGGEYPVVSKTAPNLVGVPDVTDEILAVLNAGQPSPTPTSTPPVAPPAQPASAPATTPPVVNQDFGPKDGQGWQNSVGMKFVPAGTPGVLFSAYDARVKDFAAFVDATHYDATSGCYSFVASDGSFKQQGDTWKSPGFTQGPDYPVVGVSWTDAKAFCRWLTDKERKEGVIRQDQSYRLPTDAEWSAAAGTGTYPWGEQWPPPPDAGNYSRKGDGFPASSIDNKDGYIYSAPVGTFTPDSYGLYDMGGNVWQWCEDWYRKEMNTDDTLKAVPALTDDGGGQVYRVLRGAAWSFNDPIHLRSSNRLYASPGVRRTTVGFRCVMVATLPVTSPDQPTSAPPTVPPPIPLPATTSTPITGGPVISQSWTNNLGMKFVPAGTNGVLFCVWDTRVQDYQAFVDVTGRSWEKPPFAQGPTHPAVMVSWEDAKAFCQWLTDKERQEGKLGPNQSYRLPTDTEWSKAVGLEERAEGTPASKSEQIRDVYPWGTSYPPPVDAGNYQRKGDDSSYSGSDISGTDGYVNTSPVGSFHANRYGLYDMSGNVLQWCEDWYNASQGGRVLRGDAAWNDTSENSLSSYRAYDPPGVRYKVNGFRCVLVMSAP
jgi:formylglycine-generating enzyme required for sulfatase activity